MLLFHAIMDILPSTWAFKCKRYPEGLLKRLNAKLGARGDRQQEGVDSFEIYAPVANWKTVRIMLIISILFDLKTVQADYTTNLLNVDIYKERNWGRMSEAERERNVLW
jgi:hypothetical protein